MVWFGKKICSDVAMATITKVIIWHHKDAYKGCNILKSQLQDYCSSEYLVLSSPSYDAAWLVTTHFKVMGKSASGLNVCL